MGRSRGVANNAGDEELGHRSKRRKTASSAENLENVTSGSGSGDGKKALYHCNYCNKDISGKIRIKCTKCPDFDLCLECYTVGAEVHPHKSNHPYRVMDSLSFPLISPDWNADDEILLLEGIEMYGLGNWAEVAEHVGTKNKGECIDHYAAYYVNSPCYPLPNMSHVVGKNRKELIAMAKGHGDGKKWFPLAGEPMPKEESPFSPSRVKLEELSRETAVRQSPSNIAADGDSVDVKGGVSNISGASKKASRLTHVKEDSERVKLEGVLPSEESLIDRSVGAKKPKSSGEEMTIAEKSGFNPKRQEFDPEYDMDAEQSLAEMEFKETDSETDRELKLRILRIYYSRLDERKRRKDFILERNLLYPGQFEKELSGEDKEIYERYKVFMRYHSQKEHEELIRTLVEERRIRIRIQELQECKAAGCRTRAEAEKYLSTKEKRDESSAPKPNQPSNEEKVESTPSWEEWNVTGLPGADLLTKSEQELCCENRLLPSHFLKMQEVLAAEMMKGKVQHKGDAYGLFRVDPGKIDRVYGLVSRKLGKGEEPAVA